MSRLEGPEVSSAAPPPGEATAVTRTDAPRVEPAPGSGPSWKSRLSFRNVGTVYVWLLIIVVFSFWAPETFPTWTTVQSVLNQNAISGLVALALVVPLSARVFDLSVGGVLGLCNALLAWLLVVQGVSVIPAILITLAAGALIGVVNAIVVVGWKIDSFIATLATGSLMAAAASMLTADQAIIGPELRGGFQEIATSSVGGLQVPVFLMFVVAVAVWLLLGYTPTGRRIYSTGFNEEASRLTGIHTSRLRFTALVVSATVAGIGAVLLTSKVTAGSPDIGPPYLLDAFAAAFLGATQFGGRFNAWGTVIAVLLLGTGKTGLLLVGAPVWAPSMFAGVVLLLALGATGLERRLDAAALVSGRRRAAKRSAQA